MRPSESKHCGDHRTLSGWGPAAFLRTPLANRGVESWPQTVFKKSHISAYFSQAINEGSDTKPSFHCRKESPQSFCLEELESFQRWWGQRERNLGRVLRAGSDMWHVVIP